MGSRTPVCSQKTRIPFLLKHIVSLKKKVSWSKRLTFRFLSFSRRDRNSQRANSSTKVLFGESIANGEYFSENQLGLADLKTEIVPCQFGGNPDCGSCGCVASMGLAAVAAHKLGGIIPVGAIFKAAIKIGKARSKRTAHTPPVKERLRVLP
jgi:hypothetical protein